ncbi:MAG: hypothetical protein N3E37_03425 [Candidatus Micrarchaeota archaeon]|nr:hypothetical protein [Candidatus Micrarchaeota archaeon]
MKGIMFSIVLIILFMTVTNLPEKKIISTKFHSIYELMAYDYEIKEIFEKNTFTISKSSNGIMFVFYPNLSNLHETVENTKKFSEYIIPLSFDKNVLELTGLVQGTYLKITQTNGINAINLTLSNYTNLSVYVEANFNNTISDFNQSLQVGNGHSQFILKFIGYESCNNCYINFSKYHNASFNYSLNNNHHVFNITLHNKSLYVSYTGNPKIYINYSTNLEDELIATRKVENMVLTPNQTNNCLVINYPRIPAYANLSQVSVSKLNNNTVLVINSSAGEIIYIDTNNNCRFDDTTDIKVAKQGDFLSINDKLYKIEKISYAKGCKIRWKVYANDTENLWNESDTYEFITTQ